MNEEPSNHAQANWNENHPNGPWWNEARCGHCNNVQWFLTYEGDDSNQAAFDDGNWDSWANELICPECHEESTMCENCGERFVRDEQEYALRDPWTGDDYCEDHFRERHMGDPEIPDLDAFVNAVREGDSRWQYYVRHRASPTGNSIDNPQQNGGGRRRKRKRKRKRQKSKKRKRKTKRKKRHQPKTKKRKRKRRKKHIELKKDKFTFY